MVRPSTSTVCVAVGVLVAVLSTCGLRLNVTASVPRGLYRLVRVPPVVDRGMLVTLPVPRSVEPWHSRWLPLLKPVAAVAGDMVCVKDHLLWVAEVGYGLAHVEVPGPPLPWAVEEESCLIVEEGTVFLAAPTGRSMDSRYFGAVPLSTVTAVAHPLLTWR